MAQQRKRYWTSMVIALIIAACTTIWHAPKAGAEQETFTSQCSGGTIEVWVTYAEMGAQSYFQGRGSITVDFSFPEADVQSVSVTLVAISTGPNCSAVEVRTRTGRSSGGGSSPDIPEYDFNLPAGTASFGGYDQFGGFEFSRGAVTVSPPSGERLVVRASNGATVGGTPGQALELVSSDGRTCSNGRFYYGLDATNGNTWISGCITAALAASYGWDANNSSVSYPDSDEIYETLSSGLPGWRYEHWVGGQQIGHIDCTLRRLSLGSEHREFACTMP